MGRNPREMNPSAILTVSIYTGLSALVRLARKRVDKKTRKYLESILTEWCEAKEAYRNNRKSTGRSRLDFSPIKNAEANLRRFFLKILWHSTRRFGNKEFKRVYNWEEGTVGPLNALLNYLGARLRDLAMTRFPFPESEKFQVRKYSDGTRLTVQKKYVSKYKKDGVVQTYWKAGYKGNRKYPTVLLAHPSLPGLDFVDMIRAHGIELVRQCFIHSVPRTKAHRYIRLLIHRLTPFLDYVYTGGKSGRNYFEPDADRELRMLVQEIRRLFSGRVGKRESTTRELDIDIPNPSVDILWNKVDDLISKTQNKESRKRYSKILDHIDEGRIVDRDVEKLFAQILAIAQKEGNDWHRILLSGLHHPKSLRSVIFAGDRMLDSPSSVLIVGELPVGGPERRGQIDLTVFIRRNIKGRILWTPVMVIEVKSKTSFDFNLYALQTGKQTELPPALYAWKRFLTKDEWKTIIESNPDKRVLKQLEVYEKALLDECKGMFPSGVRLPKRLWRGVIVLDTDQDYTEVFEAFHTLLDELTTDILSQRLDMSKPRTLSFESAVDKEKSPRVGLMLLKGDNMSTFLEEQSRSLPVSVENPFKERVSDNRLLTHYISIPSSTSFGNAAAWVARNWHLLNHLDEVSQPLKGKLRVYWLDLLGDYPTDQLVKRRFGLDILLKKKQITKAHHEKLTILLEDITFLNLRDDIEKFLLGDNISLETERIEFLSNDEERVIIVDGWGQLKELVPRWKMSALRDIENQLLDILPIQNVNVIWIDSGVTHTKMNKYYQRRCIKPLRHDSPRRFHIDEIIYNVPSSPRVFGRRTPRKEDTRFIIQDTPTQAKPWTQSIWVPQLDGWASKFRGLPRKDGVIKERVIYGADFGGEPMYGRSVTLGYVHSSIARLTPKTMKQLQKIGMTLIPSLGRRGKSVDDRSSDDNWLRVSLPIKSSDSPSLTDRIIFDPARPPPQSHKSKKQYMDFSKIKRGWYYDRVPIDSNDRDYEAGRTRRPPMYRRTGLEEVDSLLIRKREIQRVRNAAKFLMKQIPRSSSLYSCCHDIVIVCGNVPLELNDEGILFSTLQEVRDIILRDAMRGHIWDLVESTRKTLGDILTTNNKAVLQMVQEICPDILSLYGNNLFLALLTVIDTQSLEPTEGLVTSLWASLVEWQLYQLGFRPVDQSEELAQSQYDFQFIYSKLKVRAVHLNETLAPQTSLEDSVYGQLVWIEKDEIQDAWLALPDVEQPLLGLVSNVRESGLKLGWHQCTMDPSTLETSIRTISDTPTRSQIALTRIEEINILWFIDEIEGEEQWTTPVVIEYATSKEDGRLFRWFKLSPVPESLWMELEKSKPLQIPNTDVRVDSLLKGAFRSSQKVEDVKVKVNVDIENEHYRVKFSSGHSYEIKDTYELISLLKHPYLKGTPLRTKDDRLLFWDYKEDIEYSNIDVRREGKGHVIFLSFLKPFVHRTDLFSLSNLLPKTCGDLLQTEEGGTITLVAEVDEFRRNRGEFSFIKVKLRGLPKSSQLKKLEDEWMNPYELDLLLESEELVDTGVGKDFTLESDISQLRGIRLPSGFTENSQLVQSLVYDEEEEYEEGLREEKEYLEPDVEYLEPEYEEGLEEEVEYVEPDFEEGLEEE
ncbi:hypothetical protein E4H12_10600 [Candidatus Thorarchaeota archaeon]|nr:MAG: hypothetical protein E4H12_10600 [Candidatus Thorarchaeota archaeon]